MWVRAREGIFISLNRLADRPQTVYLGEMPIVDLECVTTNPAFTSKLSLSTCDLPTCRKKNSILITILYNSMAEEVAMDPNFGYFPIFLKLP